MANPEHTGPVLGTVDAIVTEDPGNPDFPGDHRCSRVALALSVDDHPRPDDWFWRKYHYPETACDFLLWRDGRVEVTTTPGDPRYLDCDAYVHRGTHLPYGDWRMRALRKAGYPVVLCSDKEGCA
jgi:hypothetical protein